MPSVWTLGKIAIKTMLGTRKPHSASCMKCNRSFHESLFVKGLCPLCQPQNSEHNFGEEKRIQCRSCQRLLHPDGLKDGMCIDCWLRVRKNSGTSAEGPMTLQRAYEILECRQNCSLDEVRRQYKMLAKFFHPDRIQGKDLHPDFVEFATKKFQVIGEAYELIVESHKGRP